MLKINSAVELNAYKNKALAGSYVSSECGKTVIYVGMATCGVAAGAEAVFDTLKDEHQGRGDVIVVPTGCIGMCYAEPLVEIKKPGEPSVFVSGADAKTSRKVVSEYLKSGESSAVLPNKGYGKQVRIALRNCGIIDPSKIDDYIAADGYAALAKVLTEMGREGVISEMKKSGLRGRGGAGFSTGLKWEFGYKNEGAKKYIICNADEGDPGAFMDRSILEGDPHSVLEAMAIAAFAVGSDEGIFYIRADCVSADCHCFNYRVRVAFKNRPVHKRAGVALVGVAHDIFLFILRFVAEFPFHSR